MRIKELRKFITEKLKVEISYRDKCRGSGVYLAENIGNYYMSVDKILTLQAIGKLIGVDENLLNYDPRETEEDDDKFNYCGGIGQIGRKEQK